MARGNSRIFNDNKPANYFWQMANMVDDIGLSVYAFRLYSRLVRISSIRNVDVSTRALAESCKMSMGSVSNAKSELIDAGLISITKKPSGRGEDYDEIHILDITARNVRHCEALFVSSPGELTESHSSPHELTSSPDELMVHHMNVKVHQVNTLQEQCKKEVQELAKTEEGAGAPIDFDAAARAAGIHNQPAPRKPRRSPANITESDDLRIAAYLELCRSEITPTNAEIITARIKPEWAGYWRETCHEFAANMWDVNKIGNLCDRTERKANAARVRAMQGAAPVTPAAPLTGAAKVAQETFDRQQRGMARALEYLKREGANGNA